MQAFEPCTIERECRIEVLAIVEGRGRRNFPATGEKIHSQAAIPIANTIRAGSHSPARRRA